jgi:predicted  nucleic acid-binding Zn-ribbon protein
MQSEKLKWQDQISTLLHNLHDTEEMAKQKISTLEREITQQSSFFQKEEEAYEQQIRILKSEMEVIRGQDRKV